MLDFVFAAKLVNSRNPMDNTGNGGFDFLIPKIIIKNNVISAYGPEAISRGSKSGKYNVGGIK